MSRHHPSSTPPRAPVSEEEIAEALKIFQALEERIERTRQSNSIRPKLSQLLKLAKQFQTLRSRRADFFDKELFADPAWDMLLALYIVEQEGHRMTISSLCSFSGVASTTALRWLDHLIDRGLVSRRPNPLDRRSSFAELRPEGIEKLNAFLELAWRDHFPVD